MSTTLIVGIVLVALGLVVGAALVLVPGPTRLPAHRRRPAQQKTPSLLTRATDAVTAVIDRFLIRPPAGGGMTMLEEAGIRYRPQDFMLLVLVAMAVAGGIGLIAQGIVLALVLAVLVAIGSRVLLTVRADKRRAAFADQLEESLQLMASGLRAGHSLMQSLAAVAQESEEPTREEFARILNETRVGRDVGDALAETAARMQSQDFIWVTQAIAINREVGGNLADVLDGVGATIRERGQIRRQVEALAAEGKLSAIILMLLPFGITGFLLITNPDYLVPFTQSLLGWGMLFVGAVMLVIGGLWLRKTVQITF